MPKLSLVVPVFREAEAIRANAGHLHDVLAQQSEIFSFEIIFVNDGSPDGSLAILESFREEHPATVGVVNLLRNFGQVAAVFAGLSVASGDCIAVISADLQDPPELIPVMCAHWLGGARTVIAERAAREDSLASRVFSRIFYRLMNAYALPTLPPTGFDFFLLDRSVAARMAERPEPNGFLQGQVLFASGEIVRIPYNRTRRLSGQSGWPFFKKLKYFLDGFIAYSFMPMRLISLAGISLFCLGVLASIGLVLQRVFFGTGASGWTSVMIAMVMLHGTEMLMIGVVGEYLWRTLEQSRNRPLFLVDYQKLPVKQVNRESWPAKPGNPSPPACRGVSR